MLFPCGRLITEYLARSMILCIGGATRPVYCIGIDVLLYAEELPVSSEKRVFSSQLELLRLVLVVGQCRNQQPGTSWHIRGTTFGPLARLLLHRQKRLLLTQVYLSPFLL